MKLKVGDRFPARTFESAEGALVSVPDPAVLTHLQFRRYVDCPICNTHIGQLIRRAPEIEAAGIKEVIFFHSSAESIRSHQKDVPFTIVGDPRKQVYKEFGVESSLFFLSWQAFMAGLRGSKEGHMGTHRAGGPFGLPADFLISPSGEVIAAKYGKHAYDQWSVDELLALAKQPA